MAWYSRGPNKACNMMRGSWRLCSTSYWTKPYFDTHISPWTKCPLQFKNCSSPYCDFDYISILVNLWLLHSKTFSSTNVTHKKHLDYRRNNWELWGEQTLYTFDAKIFHHPHTGKKVSDKSLLACQYLLTCPRRIMCWTSSNLCCEL